MIKINLATKKQAVAAAAPGAVEYVIAAQPSAPRAGATSSR